MIKSASFEISSNILGDLTRGVGTRTLLHPGWQFTFIEGMKRSNDVCCIKFKRHHICGGKMYKLSKKTFYANGWCSFEECPFTFKLTTYNNVTVHVYDNGNIKHRLSGRQSRHIRQHDRDNLKNRYSNSCKTRKLYLETMWTKSGSTIIAGNYYGLGSSPHVLKKNQVKASSVAVLKTFSPVYCFSKALIPQIYNANLTCMCFCNPLALNRCNYTIRQLMECVYGTSLLVAKHSFL